MSPLQALREIRRLCIEESWPEDGCMDDVVSRRDVEKILDEVGLS